MTSNDMTAAAPTGGGRRSAPDVIKPLSLRQKVWGRPEFGAAVSAFAVFLFFAVIAGDRGFLTGDGTVNYLQVSAELGIVVIATTLLMIAGEFDLTVGSVLGAAGVITAYLTASEGWPMWAAVAVALAASALLGLGNGLFVAKTRLPSFIVTLGGLFVIRGLTVALTQLVSDTTIIDGVPQSGFFYELFAGKIGTIPVSVFWWIGLVLVAWWVLAQTRFGNWTYGAGGEKSSARRLGVPTDRVKITLFVMTALAAALVGIIQTFEFGSGDVSRGTGAEFQAIAAAVIGGTLLQGGFGSALGGALGALIFGMISQGIFYTQIDGNWFQVILGTMLVGAAWVNHVVRERATGVKAS